MEEGAEGIGAVLVNGEEEINVGKGEELEKEDDDREEEKIEMFYALIRNFREARNRRRNELKIISKNHDQLEMRKQNKRKSCNESSGWTPTFELEDFKHDYFIKKPLQISPPPTSTTNCNKLEEEEDRVENGLDLKLTL